MFINSLTFSQNLKHVAKCKADINVVVTDGLYFLFAEDIFVSASSLNL